MPLEGGTNGKDKTNDQEENASPQKASNKEQNREKQGNKKEGGSKIHWSGNPNSSNRTRDGRGMASNDYTYSHLWVVVPFL
jgi:hypothetical protein